MPDPIGNRMDDGFSTKITFSLKPEIALWEKDVTPFGVDGGGPIPTETMRNTIWRTRKSKQLRTLTAVKATCAYDEAVLDDIIDMVNRNQLITITYPDGRPITVWGYLDKFEPNAHKEGEQPTANVVVEPTNQDNAGNEVEPDIGTGSDYRNAAYGDLDLGALPSVYELALFTWFDDYEDIRLANVPRTRKYEYYVSESEGDDSNPGTITEPWQTLTKVQAVIDAADAFADIRIRFKRGDTWRALTVLSITKKGLTLDDYGDAGDPKPRFTRFINEYSGGAEPWTFASGNRYTTPQTGTQVWLREAVINGSSPGLPLIEMDSAVNVAATTNSFWHDTGTNTLHVNVGVNPNTMNFESAPLDTSGWQITKDNVRLQNLTIEGVGMHLNSTSSYGLYVLHSDNTLVEECALLSVDLWYTGYHAIGHISSSKTLASTITMINCRAGFCTDRYTGGFHGCNPYVSFSTLGVQELYMRDCEVSLGMLPSYGWSATSFQRSPYGDGVFQHTQDSSHWAALSIVRATRFPSMRWQVSGTTQTNCPAWVTTEATELRAYIVDEQPASDGSFKPLGYGVKDRVHINCAYTMTTAGIRPTGATPGYIAVMSTTLDDFDGLAINCKFTADFQDATGGGGWTIYSGFGEAINLRMENCRIAVTGINNSIQYLQLVGWTTALMGPRVKLRNSIFTMSLAGGFNQYGAYMGAGARDAEIGDDDELLKAGTDRCVNNAYYLPQGAANVGGMDPTYFDGDAGAVIAVAAIPDTSPGAGDPLYRTGASNGLEYDFNKALRNDPPNIGPLES